MSAVPSVDVQLEVEPQAVELVPVLPRLDEAANWYRVTYERSRGHVTFAAR